MELLSQEQVEAQMYHGGIKRAETMIARAEEAGRAHQNPYAKEVLREYVLPIAEAIRQEVAPRPGKPGVRAAHIRLLEGLDLDAVAFIAVRTALNMCMNPREPATDRSVGYEIGKTINAELVLAQIEEAAPELYFTLVRDLGRRLSKSERHRMTVMKLQAKDAGIDWVEWPIGARDQVGAFLLGLLAQAGMVEIGESHFLHGKQTKRQLTISDALMRRIDQIKGYVSITSPTYGPCVEPPRDWTTAFDGGFHTAALRRVNPSLVACSASARDLYRDAHMPTVFAAANALQRTAWRVNTGVLDVIYGLAKAGVATDEIVSVEGPPKPLAPHWLTPGFAKEDMTDEQATEFKAWKRRVADWHTDKKLRGHKWGRFYAATRAAEMFRDYPELFFVYFADSRGRLYPLTYGVNPQGSDLQKSLIHFAKGKPLATEGALRWFHIHGANKWGFDKATLTDRFLWAHERREQWLHIAADPINHTEWLEADSPLQFLAWVLEYAEWTKNPDTFLSHLPVSMDGSCNGLQNLSALLRDEVGGRATNLTDNETMEDIYRRVAEAATTRLASLSCSPELEPLRVKWLQHGVSRSVVKRSVMTTPYGVTLRSATDYVIEDYLKHTETPFDRTEFRKAAQVLMQAVWPAIGDVVVKGRECMDWLKKCAKSIIKSFGPDEEPIVSWTSPSGFIATQGYFEANVHRIRTRLLGEEKIIVWSETDTPDLNRHSSGLAPNFVHSMDAAHLHRVASASATAGIDALAMIHDDYGTHAADAEQLYAIIRDEFVNMYERHDPIKAFADKYPMVPKPPEKGKLDIQEVRKSNFFFS